MKKENYTVAIESSKIKEIQELANEASKTAITKTTPSALTRHLIALGMQEYKKGLKDA